MASTSKQMEMMKEARSQATIDVATLTTIIFGSEDIVRRRNEAFQRVESALGTNDLSKLPKSYGNMNREEAYLEGLEAGRVTLQDAIQHKHDFFDANTERYSLANSSPFGVHTIMFIPTLKLQGTPKQREYWLPLAESGKIIGAYCQTELGHGTFVRGIETTATFDYDTDEFIIHSPTLSSTKFWPGAIGFSCSHAIVMARLMIKEKDHGVHPFIVQFRNLNDYSPMPGVELGDIGLKMSYNGTCNGFATFNQVRIPRENLLMGNAAVSRDGTYTTAPHSKLSYATLVYVRIMITRNCSFQLAQALTIATRYSIVREQGLGPNGYGAAEVSIMKYKSQHFRLLTLISKTYAILFAWKSCNDSYHAMTTRQYQGDHTTLPYMHMLAAGLKAWATQTAADGAEDARKCCGGQGYITASGLPEIVASVTATATFEGENYVMWQQVARFLLRCLAEIRVGKPVDPSMEYLATENQEWQKQRHPGSIPCPAFGSDLLSHCALLAIYRHRATRLIFAAADLLHTAEKKEKLSPADAWNAHMLPLISAARAHIEYHILGTYAAHVTAIGSPGTRKVLSRCVTLFALSAIISPTGIDALTFVEDDHLSLSQLNDIRSHVNVLLIQLLPEAVALTDAWNFTDASLCSAIGCSDGDAYRRLMGWTRQLPINVNASKTRGVFEGGFKNSIEPLIKGRDPQKQSRL
ncbi:MAG: hypothetical protein M1818_002758 [Claussenomyces sp. TS43310]|nr:MAG: hypothetical protein M1818_002758 [Claussenomyces sp. TS43310]